MIERLSSNEYMGKKGCKYGGERALFGGSRCGHLHLTSKGTKKDIVTQPASDATNRAKPYQDTVARHVSICKWIHQPCSVQQ